MGNGRLDTVGSKYGPRILTDHWNSSGGAPAVAIVCQKFQPANGIPPFCRTARSAAERLLHRQVKTMTTNEKYPGGRIELQEKIDEIDPPYVWDYACVMIMPDGTEIPGSVQGEDWHTSGEIYYETFEPE